MRRRLVGLILITLGLGACATAPERPPEIDYLAPSGLPPAPRSSLVELEPELVVGNLVDRLQQESFTVTHLDERAGHVVVVYSGDPEPYVDCGWIVAYETGQLKRTPAASATATFDRAVEQDMLELNRQLRLDGRMIIDLEPEGPNTVVSTDTTYVLTKTVDAARPSGGSRGYSRETISFKTGESGKFNKGTLCQPNGRFERAVLDSLPATSVAQTRPRGPMESGEVAAVGATPPVSEPAIDVREAPLLTSETPLRLVTEPQPPPPPATGMTADGLEARVAAITDGLTCASVDTELGPDNTVRLSGHVASEQDLARLRQAAGPGAVATDLEVHPWPFCELLMVIAPYRDLEPAPELGLAITTADRATLLREGDNLTLDIFLPRDARYLYLGYVQNDGRVGYITTMPVREWAEGTGAIRFETGFQIAEPFGREMILAVTSAQPLFDQPRPAYEPAGDYIEDLRRRLSELRTRNPEASPAAGHVFITTEPSRAS
ncbi:MAG TPA: hypothetical protein VLE23_13480 [Geminicoccaceae bacterium]|nr:hypothetical protein [Geminicoccaceae bacterium]